MNITVYLEMWCVFSVGYGNKTRSWSSWLDSSLVSMSLFVGGIII